MPASRRADPETAQLERRVLALVADAADMEPADISADTELAALGMQSLEKIECVLNIEDAFQVELDEPDLWRLRTVGDVIAAVRKAVAAGRPA
jgi:acyl carrier protein